MMSVVLIGGSCLLRSGLKLVLEESGTEIVGDYASTTEVIPRDSNAEPVIYLLIHAPGRRRLRQEIEDLHRADATCRITVMLSHLAVGDVVEVFAAGGDGLVLEEISAQALHDSLRLIALGEKVFPSQLATLISNEQETEVMLPQSPLTERELEIVRLLALGKSNKEIANEFGLALATVKVHVKSLLKKLGLSNRTQAAIWALKSGLVDPPDVTVKAGNGLRHEFLRPSDADAPSNHSQSIALSTRAGPVQSPVLVPCSRVPAPLATGAEARLGPGFRDAPSRLSMPRRSKSD